MGWLSALVGGVVGFFVGGPVGAVIGAGIGATKVGEKVVNTVLDFVTQPFMPAIPDANVGATAEADRQQGVLVQRQGSVSNIPVVYGYRKVGGAVTFLETGSSNNKYLYVAYVFSEGLVEGLREVFIDDWLLPVDQVGALNAGQLVTVNADRYKDRVQLRWFPGVYHTNPTSSTVGSTVKNDIFKEAPSFNANMNYNGLAVLFARYEWKDIKTQEDSDNNPFTGSTPEVQVSMLGKRVASLLIDGENYSYDSAPIRYSTNPAECLLDYLRNPRYGKGLTNADIDWTTWKWAARKCNQTVTYVASGIQGPILTTNMVLDTNTTLMSNTKTMLQNFRAYMPYVQGKYKLKIEDAGNDYDILSGVATIVQTFTKDDIVSDITFNGIDRSARYNVVSVTYVDPDQKWSNQQVVYPETEAERQTYIDIDGGRENKQEITLGGITNYAIAKDFARLLFNKSRRQESCIFTATSKALELEPGDIIAIQSNLLNFGIDPWRIVSLKINDDMTVDLGCVRNPDDIYPYARVGEEDIVLPTYIPKGSIIYYPGSQNTYPLGLVPPTAAVFPPDTTPSPNNPAPTNPQAPGGGGVGGGGSDSGPTGTTTTPTSDANNAATPAEKPIPFTAVLTYKSVKATKLANGSYLWEVTFTQPTDPLYDYSMIWWRYNSKSAWQEKKFETKSTPGSNLVWTLGELPKGQYDFFVRSYASDGKASENVTKGTVSLVESQTGAAGNFVAVGSGSTLAASLWVLDTSQVVPVTYDADIDWFEITPQLSGGAPLNPRKLKFKLQQIQDTTGRAVNMEINGVDIYYRAKGDTYWSKESFDFGVDYLPGQIIERNLTGDFGIRNYPASTDWLYNSSVNDLQKFEFMARLKYENNKPALKQLKPLMSLVEYSPTYAIAGNGYNFRVYGLKTSDLDGTGTTNFSSMTKNETITAEFNASFLVDNQAVSPAVTAAMDIVPSVASLQSSSMSPELYWYFNYVNNSKFGGFKIRYRPILPGEDPDWTEYVTGRLPDSTGRIFSILSNANFKFGQEYDFVVTAQVLSGGTYVDATNSLIARALVISNDPFYQNLYPKFNFTQVTTVAALKQLQDAFPALPTINPKSWNKINAKPWNVSSTPAVKDIEYDGLNQPGYSYTPYLNSWYELKFQMPSTATGLVLYRRLFDADGIQRTTASTSLAKYYGLGPWERVYWSKATLEASYKTTDGWYKVNVRGPIDANYFSKNYQLANYPSSTLVNNDAVITYSPYFPNSYDSRKITGVRPYYGAGNEALNATKYVQYLFVIEESSGVEAQKGLLLRSFNSYDYSLDWKRERIGFGEGGVQMKIVDDVNATYNTAMEAGYGRRLSDALTNTAFNKLHHPNYVPSSFVSYGTYDRFLNQPRDGTSVL